MRLLTRLLTVAAVGAVAAFLAPAGAAQAHTGAFNRDCDNVTVSLTSFQASQDKPNVVTIERDGAPDKTITFYTENHTESWAESTPGEVTYRASWTKTGPDEHTGEKISKLTRPRHCKPKGEVALDRDCTNLIVNYANLPQGTQLAVTQDGAPLTTIPATGNGSNTVALTDNNSHEYTVTWGKHKVTKTLPGAENCATPTPTPSPSSTPEPSKTVTVAGKGGAKLPTTGPGVLGVIGAAALLLAAGTGALIVSRRKAAASS